MLFKKSSIVYASVKYFLLRISLLRTEYFGLFQSCFFFSPPAGSRRRFFSDIQKFISYSSGFSTPALALVEVSAFRWISVFSCLFLQIRGQWFSLWPPSSDGSKCWDKLSVCSALYLLECCGDRTHYMPNQELCSFFSDK